MKNNFSKIILLAAFFCFFFTFSAFSQSQVEDFQGETNDLENFFGESQAPEIKDPLENVNRKIFAFNDTVDYYFFAPVALTYRHVVPSTPRKMVRNFLTNLSLPLSATNSILQGKVDNSLSTISTFLINSTIGIGGLFDVAGNKNIKYHREDFGQTLGHYEVTSGPFLIIPFLGPSTVRDFSGFAVDRAVDPLNFNVLEIGGERELLPDKTLWTIGAIDIIDTRESVQDILVSTKKESFDFYATIRSAYLQNRQERINN